MANKSLTGTTVLVTRPERQADQLVRLIEQHGGKAVRFPALEIEGRNDPDEIREMLGDINGYDMAIFISTNAVSNGIEFLPAEGPRPQLAAIGPSTARALTDAGFACDIRAASGFTSEALLREAPFQQLDGKRIVIFRGEGGRAHLGRELERRGAEVTYAEVYKRDRPPEMVPEVATQLARNEIDAITATSAETLVNLYELAEGETLDGLLAAQLVTASERVVKKAAALGFQAPALLASAPDDQALVDRLIQWRAERAAASTDESMTQQAETAAEPVALQDHKQAQDNTPPSDEQHAAQPAHVTTRPARSGTVVSLLAMLVALAALTGTAWLWWQMQQEGATSLAGLSRTQEEIDALQSELNELDQKLDVSTSRTSQLAGSSGRMEAQVDDVREGIEALSTRIQGVEKSVDDIRGVSAAARDKWIRAETEYYLQAANSRLQLARDPAAALAALEAADDRLQSLGDPSLFGVRQQLAAEIEALRSLPQPDIEGIAHTLNGLARRVDELPLNNSTPQPFSSGEPEVEGETALQKAKSAVLGAFSDMISVKRTDEEATPLLSRDEEFFLRRNLELQLQTARLALLRGDAANYRESLRTARSWIQTHFQTEQAAVATALQTLTTLEAEEIAPELPDISGSLRQLRLSAPVADDGDAA